MHSYNKLGSDNKKVSGYNKKVNPPSPSYQALIGHTKKSCSKSSLTLQPNAISCITKLIVATTVKAAIIIYIFDFLITPCSSQIDIGIGLPNLGIGFQVVPSEYKTDYSHSNNDHNSRPPGLDFLRDTGTKATSIIKNVGDKTRWFLNNKVKTVQTKLNAIRNIFPKIPSGYSVPSSSYGSPVVSHANSKPTSSYAYGPPSRDHDSPQSGFISTVTQKSVYESDTDYVDVLPQYSNPFKGGKLGHPNFGQPISMTLTPNELREMQKIVEGLDVEDQHQKGFQEGKESLQEHYHNIPDFRHQSEQSNDGTVDGFDISGVPDYEEEEDWVPSKHNFNASKLLQIGDITVPELRRRLFKKRQEILTKNKYYVQQKLINYSDVEKRPVVFLDLSVDEKPVGTVFIELFNETVPITSENFRLLATGELGFGYKGSSFHRIIPGFVMQGGDFSSNGRGDGQMSVYGPKFGDENFLVKHDSLGLVSMANEGTDTNGSQFFITLSTNLSMLDNHHVVFGRLHDEPSWRLIERISRSLGSRDGTVRGNIKIVNCGEYEKH